MLRFWRTLEVGFGNFNFQNGFKCFPSKNAFKDEGIPPSAAENLDLSPSRVARPLTRCPLLSQVIGWVDGGDLHFDYTQTAN